MRATDGTLWSKVPLRPTAAANPPLPYTEGPTPRTEGARTYGDYLELFLDDGMLQDIITHTNERIDLLRRTYKEHTATTSLLTINELKAYLGILIQSGAKKDRKLTTEEMWSSQHGCPLYRAAMSEKRYLFITRCLRFDDRTTRQDREREDRLAAIKDLWESFLGNCQASYVPGDRVTVDEQLLGFRGKCAFRFYIANKPNKYGLKIVMCCDVRTNYMLTAKVDLGKVRNPRIPAGTVGEHFTLALTEPYLDCGRTVTTDNWFTGRPLMEKLWARNTHLVGTVRQKRYLPCVLFQKNVQRNLKTSIFLFSKNTMAVSYKQKKEKNVVLITSEHNTPAIGEKSKPEVIHYYNQTKGGVDILDHMCAVYSCSRKTSRWPLCLFYGMMNIACINAFIIYRAREGAKAKVRRNFMHELARELVLPWAQERISSPSLMISTRNVITGCLGIQAPRPETPEGPATKKRCVICPWSKNQTKVKTVCQTCHKHVCQRHSSLQCFDCQQ